MKDNFVKLFMTSVFYITLITFLNLCEMTKKCDILYLFQNTCLSQSLHICQCTTLTVNIFNYLK